MFKGNIKLFFIMLAFAYTAFANNSPQSAVTNTTRASPFSNPCQGLTTAQCQQLEQNVKKKLLNKWQTLTPEEKQKVKNNLQQSWQQLTPAQQNKLKQQYQDKWQNMTPAQKQKAAMQLGVIKQE